MKKAQSTIIGFILITAIAIIVASAALLWSKPLMDKAEDQKEIARIEQKFLELHTAIKSIAAGQGSISIPFDIQRGMIALNSNNNTINYQGQFVVVQPTPRKIIFGNNTATNTTTTPTLSEVIPLGVEEPGWLTAEGALELNLHYRIVNDSGACHQIKLISGEQSAAGPGQHIIRLTWLRENNSSYSGCSSLTQQLVEINIS